MIKVASVEEYVKQKSQRSEMDFPKSEQTNHYMEGLCTHRSNHEGERAHAT